MSILSSESKEKVRKLTIPTLARSQDVIMLYEWDFREAINEVWIAGWKAGAEAMRRDVCYDLREATKEVLESDNTVLVLGIADDLESTPLPEPPK